MQGLLGNEEAAAREAKKKVRHVENAIAFYAIMPAQKLLAQPVGSCTELC